MWHSVFFDLFHLAFWFAHPHFPTSYSNVSFLFVLQTEEFIRILVLCEDSVLGDEAVFLT